MLGWASEGLGTTIVLSMFRVCVYAGSRFGARVSYVETAAAFGRLCAAAGVGIVYGGGGVGVMGALADAALAAGGEVIGVIPRVMIEQERGHTGLTQLIPVDSMHERKRMMAEMSDAFVALPGGVGTLEEVLEALTWLQLGLQLKPVGLLDVDGLYAGLRTFLEHLVREDFVTPVHHEMLFFETDPVRMLNRLREHRHELVPKEVCRVPRQ